MRINFWKQRLHRSLRQPGDRHDENRRVIEFCNWASRGLEHADLSIVEDETIDEQIAVVKSHLYLGMNIIEVSNKFNVDISMARLYIKRFKKALKKRNKSNIKYLGKSKILKEDHQNTIRKLIDNQINHTFTLNDMKKELLRQHNELQNVSTSAISRWLKQEMGMSYTKMFMINHKALIKEDIWKMIKCAALIKKLLMLPIECIFIDEFSIDARSNRQYGWL